MGFGTIVSELIIFISVMGLAVSLTFMMSAQMADLDHTSRQMNEARVEKLGTQIAIVDVSYNASANNVTLIAKNIGRTTLSISRTDVMVDGERVPSSSMTRSIPADSDERNIGLWDPEETLLVVLNRNLSAGQHEAKLSTQNAIYDTYKFAT
jgi:flagellar protein FlaF